MVYTSELICIFQLHSRRDGKRENCGLGWHLREVCRERCGLAPSCPGEVEPRAEGAAAGGGAGGGEHVAPPQVTAGARGQPRGDGQEGDPLGRGRQPLQTRDCCRSGESRLFCTLRSPQQFNFRIKTSGI